MENFIRIYKVNKKICDNLINYHKLNTEYKAKGMISLRKIKYSRKIEKVYR